MSASRPTPPTHTAKAAEILRGLGTPLVIHQPSYSMFNRWIEPELLDVLERKASAASPSAPLAQGLLTDRYLEAACRRTPGPRRASPSTPPPSRRTWTGSRRSNEIAADRGQSLAQLALAWVLRDARVTSALIGASSVAQLEDNVAAAQRLELTADELAAIDAHAVESGVDLWADAREATRPRAYARAGRRTSVQRRPGLPAGDRGQCSGVLEQTHQHPLGVGQVSEVGGHRTLELSPRGATGLE